MGTRETTFGTRTELTTSMADLGSVVGSGSDYFNPSSFSFILDKALQLEEAPVVQYPVESSALPLSPYSFEVFHHNLVSIKLGNNVFAYGMIHPSHKPLLFPRDFCQQYSGTSCAFSLKLRTQISELPFDFLDFNRIIKPAIRSDSEVIYSDINAQNNVLRTVVLLNGIDIFGESEEKETSAFFIHPKQTLTNFPVKVLPITFRDIQLETLSNLKQSENKDIAFQIGVSWKVILDRSSLNNGLCLGSFDHPTGLFNTSYSELRWQGLSKMLIDKRMEFNVIFDFAFPCLIDTELERFGISLDSPDYFRGCYDFDFCSCNSSHNGYKSSDVYKAFGGEFAFLPLLKQGVSSEQLL